eukprot:scaffold30238_cov52-Phaeocystis_antarctica.AAC.2
MCGVEALKQLTDWLATGISLGSDHRGFWLMYEMMTGTLNFKLLQDDSPYSSNTNPNPKPHPNPNPNPNPDPAGRQPVRARRAAHAPRRARGCRGARAAAAPARARARGGGRAAQVQGHAHQDDAVLQGAHGQGHARGDPAAPAEDPGRGPQPPAARAAAAGLRAPVAAGDAPTARAAPHGKCTLTLTLALTLALTLTLTLTLTPTLTLAPNPDPNPDPNQHRTWLATADPHCALERRPLPPPFDRHQAGAACHVLEPISPLAFTEAVGSAAAAGSGEAQGAGRTPELGVVRHPAVRHPAAMSVVARKMLKRVQDDTAWLAAQAGAEAQRPRLRGFGSGGALLDVEP